MVTMLKLAAFSSVILLSLASCGKNPNHNNQGKAFDVIIIGAGASGAAAASELKEFNTLVLEKEDVLGGRVRSRNYEDVIYETGALFGFNTETAKPTKGEEQTVGILLEDKLFLSNTIEAALLETQLFDRASITNKNLLLQNIKSTEGRELAVVKSLFNVIHPGEMLDYIPERQMDAFRTFSNKSLKQGNSSFISSLISNPKTKVQLGAEALNIETDETEAVTVEYKQNGEIHTAKSRAAIITTPAPITLKLMKDFPQKTSDFLESVEYGHGTVVSLVIKLQNPLAFNYIVTPDKAFNSVFINKSVNDNYILTIYFAGNKNDAIKSIDQSELIKLTISQLKTIGNGFETLNPIFKDVTKWNLLGPTISADTYKKFSEEALNPAPSVFLAGDYTWWNTMKLPFGVLPAVGSGKRAGHWVKTYLSPNNGRIDPKTFPVSDNKDEDTEKTIASINKSIPETKLSTCTLYTLSEHEPLYKTRMDEGNVAYYGTILLATQSQELSDYLLNNDRNGLWEYEKGYGVTAPDSALVIEGLISSIGTEHPIITKAADLLVEQYFDKNIGGFKTIAGLGRAEYWKGVSSETTAMVSYLLNAIEPKKYQQVIEQSNQYLLNHQQPDGAWQGKWFPSRIIPTYYAVRALKADKRFTDKEKLAVKNYFKQNQLKDGSFSHSVIETSAALLAMKALDMEKEVLDKAFSWLSTSPENSNGGEPLLYYWFEDKGEKTFFACSDKGEIASAWRSIALQP